MTDGEAWADAFIRAAAGDDITIVGEARPKNVRPRPKRAAPPPAPIKPWGRRPTDWAGFGALLIIVLFWTGVVMLLRSLFPGGPGGR